MLLLGAGMGLAFVPLTMASLAGVPPQDSGAAASMVNVMQQVGGTLGLAILVTIYGSARQSAASHPVSKVWGSPVSARPRPPLRWMCLPEPAGGAQPAPPFHAFTN